MDSRDVILGLYTCSFGFILCGKGTVALCVSVGPHESLGKVNLCSMGMSGSSEENIHM